MILRHGATVWQPYLCCCRHLGSLALRRWWWGTGSRWSDSFCTCDICRKSKKTHYSRVLKCPTLGIRLVLSNGLCGSVRCSLWTAAPSSVPSQVIRLLLMKLLKNANIIGSAIEDVSGRRPPLGYISSHGAAVRGSAMVNKWESLFFVQGDQHQPPTCLPFSSIFLLFKCLSLEFRLTASQAAADVISLKRTNCC